MDAVAVFFVFRFFCLKPPSDNMVFGLDAAPLSLDATPMIPPRGHVSV